MITDEVKGMPYEIEKSLTCLNEKESLFAKIKSIKKMHETNLTERLNVARYIRENHSFDNRLKEILEDTDSFIAKKLGAILIS